MLHTTGPSPFSHADARRVLAGLPDDTYLGTHPRSGHRVTVGEMAAQLAYGEVTAGVVGAILTLRGLMPHPDGDPS